MTDHTRQASVMFTCRAVALGLLTSMALGTLPQAWAQSGGTLNASGRDLATASDDTELRKRARIRLELATAYFGQGQYTTALDELKQVLQLDAGLSDAFELRGLIYDALNEPGMAEDSFKRALDIEPRSASVLHNYAWYLCRKQAYQRADAMFARVVDLPMSVVTAKTMLARGVCQMQSGAMEGAEKSLVRAYELEPANPATAYNLALLLYRKGDYERARFHIRRVNNVSERANAESLWLGVRIEHKLDHAVDRDDLSAQLRSRFSDTREGRLLELGRYDE